MENTGLNRRDFLKVASMATGVTAFATTSMGCDADPNGNNTNNNNNTTSGISVNGNTITLDLTKSDTKSALSLAGGFLLISDAKVMVVNVNGTLKAFTSVCTHNGCTVSGFSSNQIVCPCHGSKFDIEGKVVSGPATKALIAYATTKNGDIVTIQKA